MVRASSIIVRRLIATDLEGYKSLRDESLQAHPTAFSSDVTEALGRDAASYGPRLGTGEEDGGTFTLGAFSDRHLVGAVSCEREPRMKVRHIAHLNAMMIRSEFAGLGIGRALLDQAIAAARAVPGLELLILSVTATNLAALRLYQRAGFLRYGSLPNAIKVGGEAHTKDQMVLHL